MRSPSTSIAAVRSSRSLSAIQQPLNFQHLLHVQKNVFPAFAAFTHILQATYAFLLQIFPL
nr:MAG TPA: hypothetical protein [Caudoviricetes sp.]